MNRNSILLVEDNPYDAKMTMLALKESSIVNEIVVARDGAKRAGLPQNQDHQSEVCV